MHNRNRQTIPVTVKVLLVFLFLAVFYGSAFYKRNASLATYKSALTDIENSQFDSAIKTLTELGAFRDAETNLIYAQGRLDFAEERYEAAIQSFTQIITYKDSSDYISRAHELIQKRNNNEKAYTEAKALFEQGEYGKAYEIFKQLGSYKTDCETLKAMCVANLKREALSTPISAGIRFSAAVSNKGTVLFSGHDFNGEAEMKKWSDIVSICVKGEYAMGLCKDGTVLVAARTDASSYRIDTSEWRNIVQVVSGEQYVVGLKDNGTLTAQGHNGDGQTNIDDWENVCCIATGWRHTVGLKKNGDILITGYGAAKQLAEIEKNKSDWTDIVAVSAGGGAKSQNAMGRGHTIGLRKDGTVVAVGDNSYGQCDVKDWTDIKAIAAGDYHTVGLRNDGTVVTTLQAESSAEIAQWTDIVAISAGYGYTIGLKENGEVVSAGYDAQGQRNTENWDQNVTCPKYSGQAVFDILHL